jgi:hypothetical protein
MKKVKLFNLAILITALLLIISACSPSRVAVDDYDGVIAGGETPEVQETADPVEPAADPDPDEEPPPVVEDPGGVPDDVPVMDGAYQLQATRSGNNVLYQVDASVDEVVAFYKDELPKFEWEMAGPPDNAIGSIGTMLRENAAGDRLAINMQGNKLGGFVRLTITVSRMD